MKYTGHRYVYRIAGLMALLSLGPLTSSAHASPEAASNPQARALVVYKAFKAKDWSRLYDLSALPPAAANEKNPRQAFIAGISAELEKNEQSRKQFDDLVNSMSDLKTGKPVVKGSHATVPTSSVVKMKGAVLNLKGRIVLIKQGGAWKWDLTSGDPAKIEKASSEVFMIGVPAAAK